MKACEEKKKKHTLQTTKRNIQIDLKEGKKNTAVNYSKCLALAISLSVNLFYQFY